MPGWLLEKAGCNAKAYKCFYHYYYLAHNSTSHTHSIKDGHLCPMQSQPWLAFTFIKATIDFHGTHIDHGGDTTIVQRLGAVGPKVWTIGEVNVAGTETNHTIII